MSNLILHNVINTSFVYLQYFVTKNRVKDHVQNKISFGAILRHYCKSPTANKNRGGS
jgi:hypothetical protein